jgi:hypothetical protein
MTKGKPKTYSHHPLSPEGRVEWKDVLYLAPVENGSRAEAPGVAHPPIAYKPSEWLWKTHDSLTEILIKAFSISNANITKEQIASKETNSAVEEHMKTHSALYHPCDRRSLVVYDKEHYISCLARYFKRGLIMVGPELKDKKNYLAHGRASPTERPAIRARHSTGLQEDFPPMIEHYRKVLRGYVSTLSSLSEYITNGHSCDWVNESHRFKYNNTDKFIWAAVAIQRSIILRTFTVPEAYLGYAIMEYGKYLERGGEKGYGKATFRLAKAPASPDSYPQITFNELTLWILMSGGGSTARRAANEWGKVIRLYLVFRRSLTTRDWNNFVEAVFILQLKY